jgi:hypothetical protein
LAEQAAAVVMSTGPVRSFSSVGRRLTAVAPPRVGSPLRRPTSATKQTTSPAKKVVTIIEPSNNTPVAQHKEIREGQTVTSQVAAGEFIYFKIKFRSKNGQLLRIQLRSIKGDADLYCCT